MIYLLWKDLCLSWLSLFAGILLASSAYLLHSVTWDGWWASAMLIQFTMALVAGNIIACERSDRSAEFLAVQGATRAKIIASKAIVCLGTYGCVCGLTYLMRLAMPGADYYFSPLAQQKVAAATGLAFLGCCWILSANLSSPVLAITLGSPTPLLIMVAINGLHERFNWMGSEADKQRIYIAACVAVGMIAFVFGTAHYLRRLEP